MRASRFCAWIAAMLGAGWLPAAHADPAWQQLSDAERRAISPEITVGPQGSVHVVWLDKGLVADRPVPKAHQPGQHSHRSATDLHYRRSDDGGATWSAPVRVNAEPGSVWGFQVSKPRIAVGESGTIHVFFPGNERSEATGLDTVTARYTRSTDGGKTFTRPITLHKPAGFDQTELLGEGLAATFSFGTLGMGPDGTIVAAWQDIRGMADNADGADAYVAVSRDDGQNFSAEKHAVGDNDVCPCCQLTMAFGADTAYLGYRRLYPEGRDSAIALSSDGGASFGPIARLPFSPWKIDGCPLKPTALGVDGGRVYAAAYTGGEEPAGVYFARSLDGGRTFQDPRAVHPGAPYSDAPALDVAPDGTVKIVWQAKAGGGERRLYLAESTDAGATLSAPRELGAPAGNASYPETAVGPDGTLYVAWQHAGERVLLTRIAPADRQAAAAP